MKPLVLLVVIATIMFAAQIAHADAALSSWSTDVSLDSGRDATFEVTFQYNETISVHEYFVRSDIINVQVYADGRRVDCTTQPESVGTTIKCTGLNATEIKYTFMARNIITDQGDMKHFSYRFSVSRITNNFTTIVRLPVGFTIVDPAKLVGTGVQPIEPDTGVSGSDGRRIFITWNLQNPQLGDKLDASIFYERTGIDIEQILLVIFVLFLISAVVAIVITFKKRSVKDVLTVLHENERKVVEIIMREKEVDQRRIVKETGFSKSMISRLVKDLESRGVIKVEKKGRTNKLSLVDKNKASAFTVKHEEQKKEEKSNSVEAAQPEKLPYTPEKQPKDDDLEKSE